MAKQTFPCFIVDAFTQSRFAGNQAAVCLFDQVLDDENYQKIAAEFNLSETAYPLPLDEDASFTTGNRFSLRWFTPTVEVALCGHATLATAHVLFNEMGNQNSEIAFETQSGTLTVSKKSNNAICMVFPQYELQSWQLTNATAVNYGDIIKTENAMHKHFPEVPAPPVAYDIIKVLLPCELTVKAVAYAPKAKKLILQLEDNCTREQMHSIRPNSDGLLSVHPNGDLIRGVIVTCRSPHHFLDKHDRPFDFVSRYFAPWAGIGEDPATGSAHCALGPFWSKLLDARTMLAYQAFPNRGATFQLRMCPDARIELIGTAVTVIKGAIDIGV